MTFPTTFANLAAGNQPASLLDTMFSICGGMGVIPCTATGTNAITVTPVTNYYLPGAYANFQAITFVAANSATGAVTIRLGALAFVNLYMPSGLQANSGDIISGNFYIAAFNAALNSGAGGFQVFNASTPSVVQGVVAGFKNLKITNGGTPDTQIAITADQVMLGSSAGGTARVTNVNVTISTGTNGANGLDAGNMAANTYYSVWVIYNGSTVAGLISTSATSPTLPSGYIYAARVGYTLTGVSSTNLHRFVQYGRRFQFMVTPGSQTTSLAIAVSATANVGSLSIPTWVAFQINNQVAPTAGTVEGSLVCGVTTGGNGNVYAAAMLAPNANYGIFGSTTNPPPVGAVVGYSAASTPVGSTTVPFSLNLEGANFYWAAQTNSADPFFAVLVQGWQDNI